MEKKEYITPKTTQVTVALQQMIAGSGDQLYDDPTSGSGQMSRPFLMDDEDDFDGE
jgi:hypothetical protein